MAEANTSIYSSQIGDGLASQQQTHFDTEPEDIISKLPNSILSHILSFLPTKYSVRTSCLSKRWRYAWTWVVVLDIDDIVFQLPYALKKKRKKHGEEDECPLKNAMNKVLILRPDNCVKKFRLRLAKNYYAISDVYSWIWAATAHSVEELDLSFPFWNIILPMILFNSATLVVLKLCGYSLELNVPESASLPSLKVIHLRSLSKLSDANIKRLLSGSPLLQDLLMELYHSNNIIKRYSVLSSSLKTLIMKMENRSYNNRYQVIIDAPKLQYLEFADNNVYEGVDIELKNILSIVKATLKLSCSLNCRAPQNSAMTFSQCSFRNVKVLTMSLLILKAALANEHDIGFKFLTKLVMSYCGADFSILPQILNRLPALEVLVLNKYNCNHTVKCEDWKQENSEIKCLKYTLKTLKLGRFKGNEQEMPILEYFMENAAVLNEVRTSTEWIFETNRENAILKKVLTYPRFCSNALKVIVS